MLGKYNEPLKYQIISIIYLPYCNFPYEIYNHFVCITFVDITQQQQDYICNSPLLRIRLPTIEYVNSEEKTTILNLISCIFM